MWIAIENDLASREAFPELKPGKNAARSLPMKKTWAKRKANQKS